MTEVRHDSQGCLDDERLAAFIDGRLESHERAAIESHLADCEDCYETWMDVGADARTSEGPVRSWRYKGWWWWAGGAAALVTIAVWSSRWSGAPAALATAELVSAVGSARFIEGRLSADFAWGPVPSAPRGGSVTPSLATRRAALELLVRAQGGTDWHTHNTAGIAHLALGEIDEAIVSFERSVTLSGESAAAHSNLAAALIERWRRTQSPTDAVLALNEARTAASLRPDYLPALFNVALAATVVGPKSAAVTAWETYLSKDAHSEWAREAREHLQQLTADLRSSTDDAPSTRATRLLDEWAEAASAGRSFDLSRLNDVTHEIRTTGNDRYVVDLLTRVSDGGASGHQRRCLAEGLLAMRDARQSFDESRYTDSGRSAERARTSFTCAGVTVLDAAVHLAWSWVFSDRSEAALRLLAETQPQATRGGYIGQAARAHYIRGLAAGGAGHLAAALGEFEAAIRLYRSTADHDQMVAATIQRAGLFLAGGDQESGWRELVDALALVHRVRRPRIKYLALSYALHQSLIDGWTQNARALMDSITPVVTEWNSAVAMVDLAVRRAALDAGLGDTTAARSAIARGRDALARLTDVPSRQQYEEALEWAEVRLNLQDLSSASPSVLDAAVTRMAKTRMTQALAEAYLLRGRALQRAGRTDAAFASFLDGATALEAHRGRVGEHHLSVSRTSAVWDLYTELLRATADNPEESLALLERGRGQELNRAMRERAPDVVAAPLPADIRVLLYATLPEKTLRWSVVSSGVTSELIEVSERDLRSTLEAARSRTAGSRDAADQLSRWLLPSDLDAARTPLLAIVPDGPLHELSFASLRNRTGRFLIEDHVLALAPSLAALRQTLAYPRAVGRALVVGVGSGQPTLGLAPLPLVDAEATEVARLHGVTALGGRAATKSAVLERLASASLFHFAGHAVADRQRPQLSRLFLEPDATGDGLTPDDVRAATLPVGARVVLSSCEGARGKPFRGEGLLNMARPFLAAGAAGVVATSAPIADRDAFAFVLSLQTRIASGQRLEVALAEAQRQAIADGSPAPFWESWSIVGVDGRGPMRQ